MYQADIFATDYDSAEEPDISANGWAMACPYSSNARNMHKRLSDIKVTGKSFIADVKAQSDLCAHPYNLDLHGLTAGKDVHVPRKLLPVFSLSKTSLHADILAVAVEQRSKEHPVTPWAERKSDKLLWRGSNTGTHYAKNTPWQQSHRIRAVNLTRHNAAGTVNVLPSTSDFDEKTLLAEAVSSLSAGEFNSKIFDVSFTGSAIRKLSKYRLAPHADMAFIDRTRRRRRYLPRVRRHVQLPKDSDGCR